MFPLLLGAALAAPLSPDDAVIAALSSNPSIAAAEAELEAATGATRQSALLRENPAVDAGYSVVGGRLDLSVSQPVSLTGAGRADHKSALARQAAAEAALTRRRLEVAAETRRAYVEAVVAHQVADLAQQAFDLATRQLAATAERVRTGEAADLDLRLARLDQAKAARELLGARAAESAAFATLSTLSRRPVESGEIATDPLAAAPEPRASAGDERSDVRAARLAADAADAAVARERAGSLPPVSVGAFFEGDASSTFVGPTLGVTLPLWHQNQAGISAARGDSGVARAALEAATARAEAERRTSADALADSAATMASVPATAADAVAALASIEAGVRSGELDLVTTILLRDEVVSGQQALSEARGQLALSRITLLLATEDESLLGGATR